MTGPPPAIAQTGAAARGAAIFADRRLGLCLMCHAGPGGRPELNGDLAPDLSGVGARLSPEQLRERIVDPRRQVPTTLMPAYGSTAGLERVAAAWKGRPLLDPDQIEDLVAYLSTLRSPAGDGSAKVSPPGERCCGSP